MTLKRIDIGISLCLIVIALIVDGAQILLTLTIIGSVATILLSVFSWTLFFLCFLFLGVNYFDRDGSMRLFTALGALTTELVPIINALPVTTIGVVALIYQHNRAVAKQTQKQIMPIPHRGRGTNTNLAAANANSSGSDRQQAA